MITLFVKLYGHSKTHFLVGGPKSNFKLKKKNIKEMAKDPYTTISASLFL